MAAEDDECHDGGALKGESVLITLGPHRKKKGRITGGGHNFYLIELSGREKGVVRLKYLFVLVLLFNLVFFFQHVLVCILTFWVFTNFFLSSGTETFRSVQTFLLLQGWLELHDFHQEQPRVITAVLQN